MKKLIVSIVLFLLVLAGVAQTQPLKFMGISMNCTMSTFSSKLKGKGFLPDANGSRDNFVVMKGIFAGERVKLEVTCASKTHMVSSVLVCFNRSTSYTYEQLKQLLSEKYGSDYQEYNNLKEEGGYVKICDRLCGVEKRHRHGHGRLQQGGVVEMQLQEHLLVCHFLSGRQKLQDGGR